MKCMFSEGDLQKVRWRILPSNPNYCVSDRGQVKRVTSSVGRSKAGRIMSSRLSYNGYVFCALSKGGKQKNHFVHRLVCEAFISPIPLGLQVNHKNGVRDDNRISNLEIVTCSENHKHSFRVLGRRPAGGRLRGSQAGPSKLHENDIIKIREMSAAGLCQREIAEKFCVSRSNICEILRGRTWSHVK